MKNSKSGSQSKRGGSRDSFLEAFRDLGSDTVASVKNDLIKKGTSDIFNSFSPFKQEVAGEKTREKPFDPYQKEADLEKNFRSKVSKLENIHREEKVLFTREQKETQNQVNALQGEIKKLAKSTADMATEVKEAEMSVLQETPIVGTYHINFFIRLRALIAQLRSQIQESSFWLASWNKKAQKRNHYWNQFKKSGSKFLLSSDRYMATQAG